MACHKGKPFCLSVPAEVQVMFWIVPAAQVSPPLGEITVIEGWVITWQPYYPPSILSIINN